MATKKVKPVAVNKALEDQISYLASDLRPQGKRNIDEWEEYGINVATQAIEYYKEQMRGKAPEPVQIADTFIRVDNILTVIDVPKKDVLPSTLKLLTERYITYRDVEGKLKEHLINVPTAADDLNVAEFTPRQFMRSNKSDIKYLSMLCAANDAGYVRFI